MAAEKTEKSMTFPEHTSQNRAGWARILTPSEQVLTGTSALLEWIYSEKCLFIEEAVYAENKL